MNFLFSFSLASTVSIFASSLSRLAASVSLATSSTNRRSFSRFSSSLNSRASLSSSSLRRCSRNSFRSRSSSSSSSSSLPAYLRLSYVLPKSYSYSSFSFSSSRFRLKSIQSNPSFGTFIVVPPKSSSFDNFSYKLAFVSNVVFSLSSSLTSFKFRSRTPLFSFNNSLFSFEIRFVVGLFPLVVVSAVVPPAVPVVVEEGLRNAVSDFNFAFSASKNTKEDWVIFSIGFRFRGRKEPEASHPRFSFSFVFLRF
mmetsp:Transcript_8348/g.26721  ORF Transcript_8348/g.26721 Transcript_8348/m.26721 type:complete len:253 (-) Transcript_8348:99-857(-)